MQNQNDSITPISSDTQETQKSAEEKNPFFTFVAIVSFIANIITTFQFFFGNIYLKFWSFQWIMSVFFIMFFLAVGSGFLKLGGQKAAAERVILVFGSFYIICSLIAYGYLGYQQLFIGMNWGDYFGLLIVFGILCTIGISSINMFAKAEYLLFPAYGFLILNIAFTCTFVHKYVFATQPFRFWIFIGEIVILGIGATLFLENYRNAK